MEQLIARNEDKALRLQALEKRISVDMGCAYEKIVDIGRCLIEAKEKELVPKGHFTEWVQAVCGMSERQAERWMKIAREVPEGSYLSKLDITRMREILTLPDTEQREQLAQKALETGESSRELQAEIRKIKDEARRREAELQQEVNDTAARYRAEHARAEVAEYGNNEMIARNRELTKKLQAMQEQDGTGISPAAQKRIEELEGKLKDAEAFGDIQSEKRQKAVEELNALKREKRENGGAELERFLPADLHCAVNTFMMAAAVVPQMGSEFSVMGSAEKRMWEEYIGIVAEWVKGAREALATVAGSIDE